MEMVGTLGDPARNSQAVRQRVIRTCERMCMASSRDRYRVSARAVTTAWKPIPNRHFLTSVSLLQNLARTRTPSAWPFGEAPCSFLCSCVSRMRLYSGVGVAMLFNPLDVGADSFKIELVFSISSNIFSNFNHRETFVLKWEKRFYCFCVMKVDNNTCSNSNLVPDDGPYLAKVEF